MNIMMIIMLIMKLIMIIRVIICLWYYCHQITIMIITI